MSSEKFRRQLRQESEKWWAEGFIDATLYEKLSERYQFAQLEGEASNRFIAILMGLGAVLLGLAAITFVAANWQVWSRSLKLVLLISTFIGVNATGFYLWRSKQQRGYQRLGHGLLLLGALLLGANLGLVSQMFHQSGDLYELLVVWGLGVAVMAYSLRLTSLGVLSVLLVAIAYLFSWSSPTVWMGFQGTNLVIQHLPLIMSVVFIPLAYWCRSRVIFGLTAITLAVSFLFNFKPYAIWSQGWLLAIAFVLPPALLWSFSDRIWRRGSSASRPEDLFQPVSRSLALWFLGISYFWLAFRWWWWQPSSVINFWANAWTWPVLIDAAILGGVAILGWLELRYELFSRRPQDRVIHSGSIAIALLVSAFVLIGHVQLGVVVAIAFNVLLFLLALGLVRDGLALTDRATFWGGMVLLVLGIISRTLEYDTGLLLKAIVLALCGVGIIAAGLRFERRRHPRRVTALPHSAQEELP